MTPFGTRLAQAIDERGRFCVGIDPHAALLHEWGLDDDVASLERFALTVVEALADRVAVINHGRILDVGTPATLGGRDKQPATVRWLGEDGPRQTRTDNPTQAVTELAALHGGEVPGLTVTRPTLEDVYLEMIGAAS